LRIPSSFPIFFAVTGFLINPVDFVTSVANNLPIVMAVLGALVLGKLIAAGAAGRAFGYPPIDRLTMWSLTLPQVAATLAAALVAFTTFDRDGQRLVDRSMLNVVFVLMLTTSILGAVLTERFAPRMVKSQELKNAHLRNAEGSC
jgi:Kef-type K+ transport system membrane component KefB